MQYAYTVDFPQMRMADLAIVGSKNASLGEMFNVLKPRGVDVLNGFAVTTEAYWRLLERKDLRAKLEKIFLSLDPENLEHLAARGHEARAAILQTPLPDVLLSAIHSSIVLSWHELDARLNSPSDPLQTQNRHALDVQRSDSRTGSYTLLPLRLGSSLTRRLGLAG